MLLMLSVVIVEAHVRGENVSKVPLKPWHIAVLGIFPFLVAAVGILTLTQSPFTGMTFESREGAWYVSSVSPDGPSKDLGALAGKEVYAIGNFEIGGFDLVEDFDYIPDRASLKHWWRAQCYFSQHVRPGAPITLVIGDEGDKASYTITPAKLPLGHILERAGLMIFLGLFSLFIGLCAAIKKPDDIRARIFLVMVFSVALIFVTFGSYTSRDIAFQQVVFTFMRMMNVFAFSFFPVFFFHFCLVFPRERRIVQSRWFIPVLYSLPIIVSILYQPRISYLSLNLLFMAGLIAGVASIVHSYFTASSSVEKYQIRWVMLGVGIFAAVFLLTTFIPILFQGQRLFGDRVPSLFFILVPLSMAFAITKYHLMDIDTIFDTTIVYVLTLGVIALLDIGVVSGLASLKSFAPYIGEPGVTIIALWFAVLAYIPVRNSISRGVKRFLKRDVYDSYDVTMRLGTRLLAAAQAEEAVESTLEIIRETLHPKGDAACLFRSESGVTTTVACLGDADVSFIDLPEALERYKEPQPLFAHQSGGEVPAEYKEGVLVPLRSSIGLLGCILLRKKYSGKLYSTQDLKLLRSLAHMLSLTVDSIFQKDESERRDREARRERERISREIHDGIGSNFSNSIMMIDLIEKDMPPVTETSRLKKLKGLLGEGLSDLRDLIWTIEEYEFKLGDLVTHIQEKVRHVLESSGIDYHVGIDVENEETDLSAMVRLNIIRIVQESLVNIVKHSQASEVAVSISITDGDLVLTVSDNGGGFDPEQSKTGCYGLRNMKKRCEEMGGECSIVSSPGEGTKISVSVYVFGSDESS